MMTGRLLSDVARVLEYPPLASSDFPRIRLVASRMGITYDAWQQGLLQILFGRAADGRYACGSGGLTLSSCRQIGKTFALGSSMFVHCILAPGTTVIWTAHHTRTSDETFADLSGLAESPGVARHVAGIRRANGQQAIGFSNGSRIMFGARENGFGRGLHGADVEVFDEAQILTDRALANLLPVMNTAPDPLAVFLGNPPKPGDPSEVFAAKRRQALDGGARGMAYVELAAPRDCDSDDREAWAVANPSYPHRTPEDAIVRLRQLLPEDDFRREALGIWDEATVDHAIDPAVWSATVADGKPADGVPSLGIDMPPDRGTVNVGCCWRSGDAGHVQLVRCEPVTRAQDVVDWVAGRWPRLAAVVIDAQSPAMSLLPDLSDRHVRVTVTGVRDIARACGRWSDMLRAGTLTHRPDADQPQLAAAVAGATRRPVGSAGSWAWNRAGTDTDISPLVACTLAVHGAWNSKRRPGRRQAIGGF